MGMARMGRCGTDGKDRHWKDTDWQIRHGGAWKGRKRIGEDGQDLFFGAGQKKDSGEE